MDKREVSKVLFRIEDKIDKLDTRLDKTEQHLAVYNEQLRIHIKRTTQLEEELKPVVKHVGLVQNVFKSIKWLIVTGIAAVSAWAAWIKG